MIPYQIRQQSFRSMSDKCYQCTECYSGRGCVICLEHRGNEAVLVRCMRCRRNYCSEHKLLARDIHTVETSYDKHRTYATYCDACDQSRHWPSSTERFAKLCYDQVESYDNTELRRTAASRAYIMHRFGTDIDFFKIREDAIASISRHAYEYNMRHVRTGANSASSSIVSSPTLMSPPTLMTPPNSITPPRKRPLSPDSSPRKKVDRSSTLDNK